ncbi:hypothetical protein NDU88_008963 [Pleurodeles waltl]|uniref:Uncharacterized protein n=1 Tax=Pleurodeles waltl TaxID=8319 RepID=A0AAV7RTX8_PLEWA|nr:hypothetical protein NDU88_008963 [Pleurodeles waltl]
MDRSVTKCRNKNCLCTPSAPSEEQDSCAGTSWAWPLPQHVFADSLVDETISCVWLPLTALPTLETHPIKGGTSALDTLPHSVPTCLPGPPATVQSVHQIHTPSPVNKQGGVCVWFQTRRQASTRPAGLSFRQPHHQARWRLTGARCCKPPEQANARYVPWLCRQFVVFVRCKMCTACGMRRTHYETRNTV